MSHQESRRQIANVYLYTRKLCEDRDSSFGVLESDCASVILDPLWIVELLVSCGAAHAGALHAPPVVAGHHLGQMTRLTLGGEHLAVPDAVELPSVVAHLLSTWGATLQQSDTVVMGLLVIKEPMR